MELYERLTAAMKETYGDQYDDFRHIHNAFMVRFGTSPEYQAGIGEAGHEAEREEWRRCHTVQLGHNWIQPDRWAKYRKGFEERAQGLLAGLSKLYAEHEGDLRAAGFLKSTGER